MFCVLLFTAFSEIEKSYVATAHCDKRAFKIAADVAVLANVDEGEPLDPMVVSQEAAPALARHVSMPDLVAPV